MSDGLMREILDVKEAAALLRLHPMTLYKLLQQRKVPASKVGGQWRFVRQELLDWMSRAMRGKSK